MSQKGRGVGSGRLPSRATQSGERVRTTRISYPDRGSDTASDTARQTIART